MAELYRARYAKMQNVTGSDGESKRVPVIGPDGKPVYGESRKWAIAYRDAAGRQRRVTAFTDRRASLQRLAEIERQVERQRAGIVDVDVDDMRKPLAGVIGEYVADLERAGRDPMYVYTAEKRLTKLMTECGWSSLAGVNAQSLNRWLAARATKGAAARTINQYVDTAGAFCNWAVRERRLEVNPLIGVKRSDASAATRRRRALSVAEIGRLIKEGGSFGTVYLTAALTGLRRGELGLLQWRDVNLSGDRVYIELRPEATKSRRADIIDLPPELATTLAGMKPDKAAADSFVFSDGLPSMKRYKADLKRASIDYLDEQGRRADFHALRLSYNMLLAGAGVPLQTRMFLMRHTDPRLTARTYGDLTALNPAGAVRSLPRLTDDVEAVRQLATGTDGRAIGPPAGAENPPARLSHCLSQKGTFRGRPVQPGARRRTLPGAAIDASQPSGNSRVSNIVQGGAVTCAGTSAEPPKTWPARNRT